MNFAEILSKFEKPRRAGGGFTVRCAAHDDKSNSLSIGPANDRTLLKCHAGCSVESICSAIGISVADLFIKSRNGHATNGHTANGNGTSHSPLTLEGFAKRKGFTVEFLTEQGVSQAGSSL